MWFHPMTLWTANTAVGYAPNWLKVTLLLFLLLIIMSTRICIHMAMRVLRRSNREANYMSALASLITLYVGALFVNQYFPSFNVPNLAKQAAEIWTRLS